MLGANRTKRAAHPLPIGTIGDHARTVNTPYGCPYFRIVRAVQQLAIIIVK